MQFVFPVSACKAKEAVSQKNKNGAGDGGKRFWMTVDAVFGNICGAGPFIGHEHQFNQLIV